MGTATADALVRIASGVQLLGARAVIAGIRPMVAETIVSMGAEAGRFGALRTFGTLRDALKHCIGAR